MANPSDASTAGRIPELAFKVTVGTPFGLSIIFATIRTAVRLQQHRRLYLDDLILICACVTLIAAIVLLFVITNTVYWSEQLLLSPGAAAPVTGILSPQITNRVLWYEQMVFAHLTLTWTTIFAVKFCFLIFFRQMVERLKGMMTYWKVVVTINLLCYCLCTCLEFITCPRVVATLQCTQGPCFFKNLATPAWPISLDLLTDMLIISIPITVLLKVRIGLHQKLALAVFLCLSLCMIMVALVRISGIRVAMDPKIDVQWEIFWQQMEASISVIMVSITAFRSLLGMRAAQAREKRDRAWFSYRSKLLPLNKRKTSEYDKNVDMNLPSVPGATMSGLRTYIRGSHGSSILLSKLDKSEPLPEEQQGKLSMNNVTANHPSGLSPPSTPPEHQVATKSCV